MSDSGKKIEQKSNTVNHGDIVGGDKTTHVYQPKKSALRRMSLQLKEKYQADEEFKGYIDKLQKYMNQKESEKKTRNLSQKLEDGNREELIQEAMELKERFSKMISKNQFSQQAQEIFASILAKIITFFNRKVRPLINEGKPVSDIDGIIHDELITGIYDDVGDSKLNIDTEDLMGMVYYLTGNCHIEWDKNA